MNINDFKNAYDGIHASKSLKKRVMDAAAEAGIERGSPKRRKMRLLPIMGGIAGAAAVFALIAVGGGFLRSLFAEGRSIVVTASERPVLTESIVFSPGAGVIGELYSPKDTWRGDPYDVMPEPPETELNNGDFTEPFEPEFTEIPDVLTEYVGADAFREWESKFKAERRELPYYTFYNNMNLLSFVTYFEISEETAEKLLSQVPGLYESLVQAVARRDEEMCYRLFVRKSVPLITSGSEGYTVYTLYNLYNMQARTLSELLFEQGDTLSETLLPLKDWADSIGSELYSAAVERKMVLVSSYLYDKSSRPPFPEDSKLNEHFDQKVCDFNENLQINGVTIFNYVRRLAEQNTKYKIDLDYIINGFPGDGPASVPNYNNLVTRERSSITPEMLLEALEMINLHYYAQTGDYLYTDEEMDVIAYGTFEEFSAKFTPSSVFVSKENVLGTVRLTAEKIYETPASDWLEYRDLTDDYLYRVYDLLKSSDDAAAEYFFEQMSYYFKIRTLTAAYLDGGALAADEGLIGKMPELTGKQLEKFNSLPLFDRDVYYMTLSELAERNFSARYVESTLRAVIDECELGYEQASPLLLKAYLYSWHVDYVNLYCDEYLGLLLAPTNYNFATDGEKVLLMFGYEVVDENAPMAQTLKSYHIERFAASADELNKLSEESVLPSSGSAAETQPAETLEIAAVTNVTTNAVSREMFLQTDVNRILPASGDRGLFFCSGFGYDKWLETDHKGLDFAVGIGEPVAAYDSGVVSKTDTAVNFGNYIIIDHDNGKQTLYAHCGTLLVKEGDEVNLGDIITSVDDTGFCYGPHLHFEVRINGESVDPVSYLER